LYVPYPSKLLDYSMIYVVQVPVEFSKKDLKKISERSTNRCLLRHSQELSLAGLTQTPSCPASRASRRHRAGLIFSRVRTDARQKVPLACQANRYWFLAKLGQHSRCQHYQLSTHQHSYKHWVSTAVGTFSTRSAITLTFEPSHGVTSLLYSCAAPTYACLEERIR
jgi:hypothetical protein